MLEHDADVDSSAPTWISFADLMTGLLGAFVLLLVGVMAAQLDMASKLEDEVQKRQVEEQKRLSLEQALAIPLVSMSRRLDCLTIDEFADMTSRNSPDLLFNVMGYGVAPGAFDQRKMEDANLEWIRQVRDRAYVEIRLEDQ